MLEDEWGGEKEDWSDKFDDMESNFWEDHYAKPERRDEMESDYLRSIEEDAAEEGKIESQLEQINSPYYQKCYKEAMELLSGNTNRQKEIVKWLATSRFTVTMENNGGFYVSGQRKGKLKDGRVFNIINWLCREGIKNGRKILQYKLQYNRKEQRLYFLIK